MVEGSFGGEWAVEVWGCVVGFTCLEVCRSIPVFLNKTEKRMSPSSFHLIDVLEAHHSSETPLFSKNYP